MTADDEKGRENWHRITLRIPPELHQRLLASVGNLSLNAWLMQLLDDGLYANETLRQAQELLDRAMRYKSVADIDIDKKIAVLDELIVKSKETSEEEKRAEKALWLADITDIVRSAVKEELALSKRTK